MDKAKRENYTVSKVKTEISTVQLNREGVESTIVNMSKVLAGFDRAQKFEKIEVKFGRTGGAVITFTNPKLSGEAGIPEGNVQLTKETK